MAVTKLRDADWIIVLLTALEFSAFLTTASPADHWYSVGDRVPLFVNKVGPLNNPSETYSYYDLPFCRPDPLIDKMESLGEVLNGDHLTNSIYELKFGENKVGDTLCEKKLTGEEVAKFKHTVLNDFYFQMYLDDLPIWGFIGKVEEESLDFGVKSLKYYLFTDVQFDVLHNGNQVIEVHTFCNPNYHVDITQEESVSVKFTYSIIWNETTADFENRMDAYSRDALLPISRRIHLYSFVNSIVIVLPLMVLLTLLYMRHLKNDLRKFSTVNEDEDKEVGWKYIQGDVFRQPTNISLFCAVIGTGTQFLTMVCILFLLAFFRILYPYSRGGLSTSLVLTYAFTSFLAGYSAASFHCQFSENGWERSVLLAGVLYSWPLFVIFGILNTVAISYGATSALPFGTIIVIILIYTFLIVPLLALGGVVGFHFRSQIQAPSATKKYTRETQCLAWYRRLPCQMFIGGLLTFSAIAPQLQQFYASIWGFKIYTLPGILFITFIIVILISAILSVGLTHIQLSVEDHKLWWRSMFCGGSTAIFMFGYSIYFYMRSNMTSFMQLSFFIGYNACICYAFFLMLGSISFRASFLFARRIYHPAKSE